MNNTSFDLSQSESILPDPNISNISFIDSIKQTKLTTWIIIFGILSLLGFNIFVYLAKGTQTISDVFRPIVQKITYLLGITTLQTINTSAKGTQSIVNTSADIVNKGLNSIENTTQQIEQHNIQPITLSHPDITQNNTLNKALNNTTSQRQQVGGEDYHADDSTSSIQLGKAGWCYIGEDRGFRSCAEVGVNDTCMSGEIFPTNSVCVNPNLRV
jgi:hypothetical protein